MRFLLLLLLVSSTAASDFNLFISASCDPGCIITVQHEEQEEFYSDGRLNSIVRPCEGPVPEVNFQIESYHNYSSLGLTTYEFTWISHQNRTFFFQQDGIFIVGHYFCPDDRCEFDHLRDDYRKQVNRMCFVLIFSGIFFFLWLSGLGEALYKYLKLGLRGPEKKSSLNYDQLVLTEKSAMASTTPKV